MDPNGRPLGDGFAAAMSNLALYGDNLTPDRTVLRAQTPVSSTHLSVIVAAVDLTKQIASMTHGEALHEIGRLEGQLNAKETQIRELRRERDTLNHDNADFRTQLTEVKAELQKVEREKQSLTAELELMREEVQSRDGAMKKLNDDLAKAQRTIKVQSDHIATPSTSTKPPMTPHRVPNPIFPGPPPSYHGHRDASSFDYPNPPSTYPPPMPRQRSSQMPGGESDAFDSPYRASLASTVDNTSRNEAYTGASTNVEASSLTRPHQEQSKSSFQSTPTSRQTISQLLAHDQPAPTTRPLRSQMPGQDPFLSAPIVRQSSQQLSAHYQPAPMTRTPRSQTPSQDPFITAPMARQSSLQLSAHNQPAAMTNQPRAQMPGGDHFQSTTMPRQANTKLSAHDQPAPMTRQTRVQMHGQESFLTTPMTGQSSAQQSAYEPFQPSSMACQPSGQGSNRDPFQSSTMARQPSAQRPGQDSFLSAPASRKASVATPAEAAYQTAQETYHNGQGQTSIFNGRRGSAIAPTPGYNSFGGQQVASLQGEDALNTSLVGEHTNLFKEVEQWARNYANAPYRERDQAMPDVLQSNLRQLTNPEIAIDLISTSSTRYFSIAKLINNSLAKLPLRPLLVKGFTAAYDMKIANLRSQLSQVGIPIHVRRALLVASAEVVQEMMQDPAFERYKGNLIAQQVGLLWHFLEPLFASTIARNEAWEDLNQIWREAVRIGLLQLSKASSFTLDFPQIGPASRFNPSNMINRDATFKQDPQTLGQMGVCVRLAISPIVTETNFMSNTVVPRTMHYANVLLQL